MKIVNTSVSRPIGVLMLVIGVLALGFVSLTNLKIDLFPNIDIPVAVVATSYQGAGPEEVEKQISRPLESMLSSIEGMDSIQSSSEPNSSLVIIFFKSGTNLDNALIEVREKVDQVKSMLPDDAGDPSVLRFDPQQVPVMQLGLTGANLQILQDLADDQIAPYLERVTGVASASVSGGKEREIQIELDRASMQRYGITTGQVAQALQSENQSSSAGVLTKGDQELQIRVDGAFTSIDDIASTLIPLASGHTIRVDDVATVRDGFKTVNNIIKVNNQEALVISIQKQSDANTIAVADGIHEAIEELNETLPEGVELSTILDSSTFIRASISSVISNMVIGGIVALAVLLLFLRSIRTTLVVGLSIPIAVISTFVLMYFTGETLNILSMGGLALGIGMMVDNSIVILENVFRYRQQGASIMDAARKGASELGSAIIASTVTTLVVFLPIVFVEGIASDLFTPLAMTVSFSLAASLVVALTLVPMLSSKLLTSDKIIDSGNKGWFNRIFSKIETRYASLLGWALRKRKTTIAITLVLFISSFTLVPFIGTSFIPASDQGQISISVKTASGSLLSETESIAMEVSKKLEPYEEVIKTNFLTIGGGGDGLSSASNEASFTIELLPASERNVTTAEITQEWSDLLKTIPGAEITVSENTAGFSSGSPISIQISGPEQEVLDELAQQVIWMISDIEGVSNPQSSSSEGRPEILIEVDRAAAAQFGLTYQQVLSEVETSFNGMLATTYREDGSEYDVTVMLPDDQRTTIRDLETTMISTQTGSLIPISAVAELKQIVGPVQITRENQQRQVNVTSDVVGANLGTVSNEINQVLSGMNFPDGYSWSMGGDVEDMMESFTDLALALVFSIFLVYIVMAIQFESLIHPLVIMFSLPTTMIGVLVGLFVTGHPLSVPALIGIIMLAGIVVNNAIVLVDYINTLRREGMERFEAIHKAGPVRLRPILMTTLTTVLAMIPLGMGMGEGGEAQAPLAVVIIFGLSSSTLLTLVFVPVMYSVLEDILNWSKKLFSFKRRKQQVSTTHMSN